MNNPEATAKTVDADGWLHTGDIGVMDDDGYLTVVDRLKELIKVKGFQVAPAELESMLLKHPKIADVAVIPVADEDSGEVPKAIVVMREALTAEDVMAFCRAEGGALQARAPRGVRRRDSEVAVRKNPAANAGREGTAAGARLDRTCATRSCSTTAGCTRMARHAGTAHASAATANNSKPADR